MRAGVNIVEHLELLPDYLSAPLLSTMASQNSSPVKRRTPRLNARLLGKLFFKTKKRKGEKRAAHPRMRIS